ncbi:protein arginine N-methyltransferase 2-like isoform X2 [Mercenaria mercenaria]|uniref:protein arginine N-methyltransferase 2-like isoform X2 n=1 Tax=Mercenaria mercenaria TaxID=6596 RepID=UPI001E1DB74F|nr:protein arginine N-methyltransferase 2-like isoform X2 [Mercenaria mercenaria]XP_045178610.1 protein arginine N-methyltransferase 2-like isoform X2 [Mercenaria mercenaria]
MQYGRTRSTLKLHHEMLSDRPRTLAYMRAIMSNSMFLTGKVILDVGCGTGIISMMCARHADPKMIYAVEASDIAVYAREVIEQNKMSEQIKLLHGYAENIELPEKVHLIISEWMGTMLLFEMMIESVILMRDRYLQEDGVLWPSTASLFLVPCSAHDQYTSKVDFWDNQFGFDFSCLKPVAKEDLLCKPLHDYILPQDDCLSEEVKLFQLDMKTVTVQYLEEIISHFNFCIRKAGTLHGFCAWFEVGFDPYSPNGEQVLLNTGPSHELTHWKQDLFLLDEPVHVKEDDQIVGSVVLTRNPDYRRHLRAEYQFTVISGDKTVSEHRKKFFIWR